MKNISNYSGLAGIILAVGLLTNTKPANALIYNFSTNIYNKAYSGTIEFSGTGTRLAPLLSPNTRLTEYQGNQVNGIATAYGSSYHSNTQPLFDVTSSTLTTASDGGLTYAGGQSLEFFAPDIIGDLSILAANKATFSPATAVPWNFSPTQGTALGLPLFIGLRMLKNRRALKNSTREVQEMIRS